MGTTWNKGLIPLAILLFILGGLGFLLRLAVGGIEQSAGEVLFLMWPSYFLSASFVCGGLALTVGRRPAGILGLRFSRTSEVVSLLLSMVFSVGFVLGLLSVLITDAMGLPNATVSSQIWSGIGVATGIVCGGVAAPTLAGAAFLRLGLSRSLIMFLHLFLFVGGILLAIILWRYGVLDSMPLLLTQVVGALCATPLGALVFRIIAPREVRLVQD